MTTGVGGHNTGVGRAGGVDTQIGDAVDFDSEWARRLADPQLLRTVFDSLPVEVYIVERGCDGELRVLAVNSVAAAARAAAPDELAGATIDALCREGVHRYVASAFRDANEAQGPARSLAVVRDEEGVARMHQVSVVAVPDSEPRVVRRPG